MYRTLHPRADIDRLYITSKEGVRGLTTIEITYTIAKEGLQNYTKLKEQDKYLVIVYRPLRSCNNEVQEQFTEDWKTSKPEAIYVEETK